MSTKQIKSKKHLTFIFFSFFLFLFAIGLLIFQLSKLPKEVKAVVGTLDIKAITGGVWTPGGIWDSGGNVGIGTTAPAASTVGGQAPKFAVIGGYTNLNGLRMSGADTANTIYSAGAALTISTGGGTAQHIILSPNGNVGIGTTAPGYKLHLAADGAANLALDRASADASGNWIFGLKSRGTQAAPTTVLTGDDLLLLRAYGYDGASNLEAARITMEASGTVASTQMPGNIMFYTATDAVPSVVTERMRINSAGNVGIGTAGPGQKLDVAGIIRSTGNNIMNNTSPTTYFQDTDHRSAMIHVNSNIFYVLRGDAINSLTWATANGYWPLTIDLETNDATFGRNVSVVGTLTVTGNANICNLVTYTATSGTVYCPAGFYTYSGVGLTAGQLLCCKVSNPI